MHLQRCLDKSPCDPNITQDQINAHKALRHFKENNAFAPKILKINLEERKDKFMYEVAKFKGEYPDDMLREFYDYWTEHGTNDRKFRKEKEKSFDVGKRLARWFKNYKPSKKNLNQLDRVKNNLQGWE